MVVCEELNGKSTYEQMQGHSNFVTFDSYGRIQIVGSTMSDDKPFACRVPGCNQKFVNEDHLEVHRKKHDVHLGFSDFRSLDTPVIADQTPTPTRFLKNLAGEEGLFNDLHPNPFDAEFRQASSKLTENDAEDGSEPSPIDMSTTLTPIDAEASGDSDIAGRILLDTEVKPEEVSVESDPQTVGDLRDSPELQKVVTQPQGATTVVVLSQPNLPQANPIQLQAVSDQFALNGIPLNGPIMIKLATGQTIPVLPPSVTNPQVAIPTAVSANPNKEQDTLGTTIDGKPAQNSSVKMKLKSTLLSNQSQGNMNVMAQAVDVVTKQQQEVKLLLSRPTSVSQQEIYVHKRQRVSEEDDNENKRQKFLERNRAAASRCRNKRKQWVVDLEKRSDDLNATNNSLNTEVGKLRNEVAQLKELLLAHKDCPVTLQQRAAGLFMRVGDIPGKQEQDVHEASGIISITTTTLS
ncbi:cyclic AMP-dependent transcription factor ATF-7 isoform X1 [Strongylocentrotus purpuratus]|uniref:Cyclic AMP-dependent transcription factor ATF-2 n=2 Tax=Strongylocentrotus purpuratus TaxID=7668 RepID=A0A7M7HGA7_STRPU|nr:cyclic AMP-dependent transcription factor ATF-7 isoform X1 [Strongylocentrotus purpuratus]|eukprot:XP_011663815.1 PREDICTED: cyclic AMP-dependent transcription factor ATF-7 isoform X1 [Strongylocentrotus purpuratus]